MSLYQPHHQEEEEEEEGVIVDAFCGVGGNAIQLALASLQFSSASNSNSNTSWTDTHSSSPRGSDGSDTRSARPRVRIVAIDINPSYIDQARHNASIYGVEHLIEFIVADFFSIAQYWLDQGLGGTGGNGNGNGIGGLVRGVYLSPPWSGPSYLDHHTYSLSSILPRPGPALISFCRALTENIVLFLPRTTSLPEILALKSSEDDVVEVEGNYINGKLKALSVYFGGFCDDGEGGCGLGHFVTRVREEEEDR